MRTTENLIGIINGRLTRVDDDGENIIIPRQNKEGHHQLQAWHVWSFLRLSEQWPRLKIVMQKLRRLLWARRHGFPWDSIGGGNWNEYCWQTASWMTLNNSKVIIFSQLKTWAPEFSMFPSDILPADRLTVWPHVAPAKRKKSQKSQNAGATNTHLMSVRGKVHCRHNRPTNRDVYAQVGKRVNPSPGEIGKLKGFSPGGSVLSFDRDHHLGELKHRKCLDVRSIWITLPHKFAECGESAHGKINASK